MTANSESNDGRFSLRFPPDELEQARACADRHGFKDRKFAEWIRQLVKEAIARDQPGYVPETSPATRPLTIIDQLKDNEEAADLIYQIVADKLRLDDLRAELAAFARSGPATSIKDLDTILRLTAARIASTPREPVDETEVIVRGELPVTLTWDRKWSLQEFLALKTDERKKASFYLMTISDVYGEIPYYFWHIHSEFEKYLEKLQRNGLNATDRVTIYGATCATPITSANLKHDLETRLVNMVRYVARDNNLGKYELLADKHLRYYYVVNAGRIPPGLPCEFAFGWVSDAASAGEVNYLTKKDAEDAAVGLSDTSYRPVVHCRWHYTEDERKARGIREKMPFDEEATPRHMQRYLAY